MEEGRKEGKKERSEEGRNMAKRTVTEEGSSYMDEGML